MRETIKLPRLILLAARAALELAFARLLLTRIRPGDVLLRNARAKAPDRNISASADGESANRTCRELSWAIRRIAIRVPWRADCLVQALAGQNWLLRHGISSEIVIGTTRNSEGGFEAHAWLSHGKDVLLGGNIEPYHPLLAGSATGPDPD